MPAIGLNSHAPLSSSAGAVDDTPFKKNFSLQYDRFFFATVYWMQLTYLATDIGHEPGIVFQVAATKVHRVHSARAG